MGVISRKIFPVCESLCFFCPALRARSRHPVKRYKKLLADIFPRSQVDFFCEFLKKKNSILCNVCLAAEKMRENELVFGSLDCNVAVLI